MLTLTVDVVVVTYESAAEIEACITAVHACADVRRVIVVDNASHDDSVAAARRSGADLVLENAANLGFARAVNLGLSRSTSDHVLLLNPDAAVTGPALASMSATLRRERGAAIVAPLLRHDDGVTTTGAGRFATLTLRIGLCVPVIGRAPLFAPECSLPPSLAERAAVAVDYVFGAAMLLERAFLVRSGGLDERFFLFAEDEDICRQARSAGLRVLLDTLAVVDHRGGASCRNAVLTEAQRLYSTYRLFGKWRGRSAAAAYRAGILSTSWLRVQATRVERRPQAALAIEEISRLFEEAIRSGVDPLVAAAESAHIA